MAAGRPDPVVEGVASWRIAAVRQRDWLPGWYRDVEFRRGKAGRREAEARSRPIAESLRREGLLGASAGK